VGNISGKIQPGRGGRALQHSGTCSLTITFGGSGIEYSGWQAIEVFDPQFKTSEHADFRIQCQ